jgi:hypothetical protein
MKNLQLVVPALLLTASGALRADTVIDTAPSWNGTDYVYPFGVPNSQTYGQTITVPTDNVLDSFSFYMDLPSNLTFSGYVFQWNGSSATGPELFKSVATTTTGSGTFEHITFDTGGLALTAGQQYVLFASTSEYANPGIGFNELCSIVLEGGCWGQVGSDVYAGGEFVFINNGTDISQWTSTPWGRGALPPGWDLAFDATLPPPQRPSRALSPC